MLKRHFILLLTVAALLPALVKAQGPAAGDVVRITHGPWLTDMSADGVTVLWTTDVPALSWVEAGPADGKHFYAEERPRYYDVRHGKKQADRTLHRVRVTGLEAGKTYNYRVFSQRVNSMGGNNNATYGATASTSVYRREPLTFRTFDPAAKKITFLVVNDIHGDNALLSGLFEGVDPATLDFVVLNGDMAHWVEDGAQVFTDYMDTCVKLFAQRVPVVYARGNHETRGKLATGLIDYFPTPTGMYYYTFRAGPVSFLVLDGGEDKPDSDIEYGGMAAFDPYREQEAAWLSAAVASPAVKEAAARVVFLHIPPLCSTWHGPLHVGQTLLPVLNGANVDVMFSGHTHRYAYRPADAQIRFPLVTNSNSQRLLCTIEKGKLTVRIAGTDGKTEKTHEFPVDFR